MNGTDAGQTSILRWIAVLLLLSLFLTIPFPETIAQPAEKIQLASINEIQLAPGVLYHVSATESIEFDWFVYIPSTMPDSIPAHIWVTGLHGNYVTDDYSQIVTESEQKAMYRTRWAEEYGWILLVPVIPRPATDYVYTVAFPSQVLDGSRDDICNRPDMKLNAMLDALHQQLTNQGIDASEKVLINGFSAGAMFAQRYALLQPDRVLAVAVGQSGGALTLPAERYNGTPLEWPVGIANLESMTGDLFQDEQYRHVHQFVFIGEDDTTNTTLFQAGELWNTQDQIDFLNNTFGDSDPVRVHNQAQWLINCGYPVEFRMYPGIGHSMNRAMYEDVFEFFRSVTSRSDK